MNDTSDTSGSPATPEFQPPTGDAVPETGALLGLDYGRVRIGVAVSTPERSLAVPLENWERSGDDGTDAEHLLQMVADQQIVGLVVGLPLNMDGSEGPSAQSARQFAENLAARLEIPVALWDARLSTAAVERTLIDADLSRRRRAEVVDKLAAAYILQGALDYLAR